LEVETFGVDADVVGLLGSTVVGDWAPWADDCVGPLQCDPSW